LTTAWVLTEVADGLVEERAISRFLDFYDQLQTRTDVAIIACADDLFRDGLELYRRRLDKEWSLTDCISFVVMQQHGLTDALTADHHFEQAGFTALLK
jgi:predicted nucleic acid-binding protein